MIIELCTEGLLLTIIERLPVKTLSLLLKVEFSVSICKNGINSCLSKIQSKTFA